MTTTPIDNTKVIPLLCSLSGCWSLAQGHSTDQIGHTLHHCTPEHKTIILAQRAAVYGLCQVTTREVRYTLSDYPDDMLGAGESSPDED